MDEQSQNSFEERSRSLFNDSVEGLDMRLRSKLTQARYAAMEAAAASPQPWFFRMGAWKPAVGVAAAAVLATALWMGAPLSHHSLNANDGQTNLDDLELVASSDATDDPLDMLQDDVEFYDWANKGAGTDPSA